MQDFYYVLFTGMWFINLEQKALVTWTSTEKNKWDNMLRADKNDTKCSSSTWHLITVLVQTLKYHSNSLKFDTQYFHVT